MMYPSSFTRLTRSSTGNTNKFAQTTQYYSANAGLHFWFASPGEFKITTGKFYLRIFTGGKFDHKVFRPRKLQKYLELWMVTNILIYSICTYLTAQILFKLEYCIFFSPSWLGKNWKEHSQISWEWLWSDRVNFIREKTSYSSQQLDSSTCLF